MSVSLVWMGLLIGLLLVTGCQYLESSFPKIVSTTPANTVENVFGYVFNVSQSKFNQTYLEYDDGKEIITLKIIRDVDLDIAETISSDRIVLFRSIFEPKRVDYPGQYTRTIECPEEFKPKYYEFNNTTVGERTKYFVGYANVNKVAGACTADLIYYNYAYGFMSCPQERWLIEIEYYSILEFNKTQMFMKSLDCTTLHNSTTQ
ncbi:MAG: hypothetical protein WC916_06725 [Candidatus Woesearchaeota archaeon]